MPIIRLTKRSSEGGIELIVAAVVSCVAAALLTLCGLWFYHRWLRRTREQAVLQALDKVSPTSSESSHSNYPPPPAYYPPLRAPRRARHPFITKPSIPDLPRISEEGMSMASVSPSVQSRPSTFISLGQQGQLWSAAMAQEREKEEVMGS
ncbi:hypothetical protein CspHIS471_0405690 [Cutaneotrichosporon sp. HIS471]|nr:hypothetical protein CspHIS471_0405690 [Cutaneotrichosporon sp. HIS471]